MRVRLEDDNNGTWEVWMDETLLRRFSNDSFPTVCQALAQCYLATCIGLSIEMVRGHNVTSGDAVPNLKRRITAGTLGF